MDGHNTDALFVRGRTQDRNPGKPSGWRSKSTGRSKSPRKSLSKYWKCGKIGHYKKDCKSKKVEKPVPLPQRQKPPLKKEVMFT